jgi:hypothetical protein
MRHAFLRLSFLATVFGGLLTITGCMPDPEVEVRIQTYRCLDSAKYNEAGGCSSAVEKSAGVNYVRLNVSDGKGAMVVGESGKVVNLRECAVYDALNWSCSHETASCVRELSVVKGEYTDRLDCSLTGSSLFVRGTARSGVGMRVTQFLDWVTERNPP